MRDQSAPSAKLGGVEDEPESYALFSGTFIDWEMDQQISLSSVKREMPSPTSGGEWPHAPVQAVDLLSGKELCSEWPGDSVDNNLNMGQQTCPSEIKAISVLCWIRKSIASRLREVILFFRPAKATFVVLSPVLDLSARKGWTYWSKWSEGPHRWVGVYRLTWENRLIEIEPGTFQPGEERAWTASCQYV